jgi:FkbM family methyltransferase
MEALSANVEMLAQNVERNGLGDRVTVMHALPRDRARRRPRCAGTSRTRSPAGTTASSATRSTSDAKGGESEKVPTVSLADLPDIDFLKIDCEGCEYTFLDTPAVSRVTEIRGEFHDGFARIRTLLDPTHDVES